MEIADAERHCRSILEEVSDTVVAEESVLETVLTGFLSGGHVLLEDVPGTGKTVAARTFATVLGLSFSRVQFTPDLLPSDLTGTQVFNEQTRQFEFREGPVFANIVLADEINRASPKTQSALLEAMDEHQVSVGTKTHRLPSPFFVIATQNPVESEGTFELPAAQTDRFMVKTALGYPDVEGERELVDRRAARQQSRPTASTVCPPAVVTALRDVPESVRVSDPVRHYLVEISRETRVDDRVKTGVSPRGTQRLFEAVRAMAVIRGRDYVTPDDVIALAEPVLAHRLRLAPDARVDGIEERAVIDDIVSSVPVPKRSPSRVSD